MSNGRTDGWADVLTRFFFSFSYVRKSSQQTKKYPTGTVQTYVINFNFDFISSLNMQMIQCSQQVSILGSGQTNTVIFLVHTKKSCNKSFFKPAYR